MTTLEAREANIGLQRQRVSRRMVEKGTPLFGEDIEFLKRHGFTNREILIQYGDDTLLRLEGIRRPEPITNI